MRDAAGVGREVVQHSDMWDLKFHRDFRSVHSPAEVCWLRATFLDDPGDAESGGEDRLGLFGEEFTQNGIQAGITRTRVALLTLEGKLAADDMKEGDVRLCAADVAREDEVRSCGHFSVPVCSGARCGRIFR